jgi:lysylphosphatidylglycerol synthetase-like protein (DUF2156 family)
MVIEAKAEKEPISSLEVLQGQELSIVECVRRWGGLASDAVLDPSCKHFSLPTIEGLIGYHLEPGCAVVYGDPVCSPADTPTLVSAFHHHCQKQGRQIVYVTTSESFAKWAINHVCGALMEWGEELTLDPHHDPRKNTGVHGSLVRRKTRHALREGVTVNEYLTHDATLEKAIEQVSENWLKGRQGPQVHLSHVRLFDDRFGKRWFYAQQGNRVVGVVVLNQLQAHQGWLLNRLMITQDAPNGTPELLVVSALEILAQEQCHFVTFGTTPADQLGEIEGLGKISAWMARQAYQIAKKVFQFQGLKMFWRKFDPQSRRSYLLFSKPRIGPREIAGLTRALNVNLQN